MASKPNLNELLLENQKLKSTIAKLLAEKEQWYRKEETSHLLFEHMLHEVHMWQVIRDNNDDIINWKLINANPVALNIWDESLSNIVGKTADIIFPNSNPVKLFLPVVKRMFNENKPQTWEEYFPDTKQTLHMISIPFDDYFISTGLDISDVKEKEEQLEDSLLRLAEVIKAGNVGLWDWDIVTNQAVYSKEWKSQIGYEDYEISDDLSEWEQRVHPDDLEKTLAIVKQSLDSGNKNHQTEFRFRHKNGSYRWILAHGSVIRDEHGNAVRMLGSHIDITEKKQMELLVNQHEKMNALGTLTSGIAHDFNNILSPILGYAQLALIKLDEDKKEYGYIKNIEESALRAKSLVEKLLVINKTSIDSSEPVYLKDLLSEVLTVLNASLSKDIIIETTIEENLPPIIADASQIYQVILNLTTNSIQAMGEVGKLSIHIGKSTKSKKPQSLSDDQDDYICLTIQDNGCGIEQEIIDNIYDPFFTTKEVGEHRGTGLGLAIVASIVNSHHGHIELDSTPDSGTTFYVFFPIAASKNTATVDEKASDSLESGNGNILLVDDEEMLVMLGMTLLESLGYEVSAFTDSMKAYEELVEHGGDYDLVITDYAMPHLNGPQLISKIKALDEKMPILVVTGYGNIENIGVTEELNCDGLLSKPYDIETLSQMVKETISKNQKL